MGGSESIPIVPEGFPGFGMYFSRNDSLTLIHSDKNLIELLKTLLQQFWPKGIQGLQNNYGAIEFKLKGWPFAPGWSDTNSESLESQIMCGNIMKGLLENGWTLICTSDLSRGDIAQRSAWFFRRSNSIAMVDRWAAEPSFTVSRSDRLIFLQITQQMQNDLIDLCNQFYRKGIQEMRQLGSNGIRIKFHGNPWNEKWRLENEARPLLLAVIQYFEQRGYWFYGTASIQGQTDTVYFMPTVLQWPLRLNPPLYPAESNRYFAIGLDRRDRLRVLNFPDPAVIGIIESTIQRFWPKGFQEKSQIGCWFEFKLAGWPWDANGCDTVASRMLITQIFQNLHMHGWAIMSALDTSRAIDDTSMLIFRSTPAHSMQYMCVSLNETDKLRLINAPPDVVEAVRATIQSKYTYGIQRFETYGGVPEFKLAGYPWSGGHTSYSVHARQLMTFIMDCLMNQGFGLAVSADVSAKFYSSSDSNGNSERHKLDVHSWFLAKPIA